MTISTTADPDRALKERHRTMSALGDYPRVATDLVAELGQVIVDAAGLRSSDRVPDVAAGAGNASLPVAESGAHVIATDLTPRLLAHDEKRTAERGLSLEWLEADVEALPFDNGEFDVVISVVGVMFDPHHQQAADEIIRVSRSGGRIALINWTPEGMVGALLRALAPYATPPPPDASPPPLWGSEDRMRELSGNRVSSLDFTRRTVRYPPQFDDAAELRDYYKGNDGPTIAVYRSLDGQPDRIADLDRDFTTFLTRQAHYDASERATWAAEYLLVTATKA